MSDDGTRVVLERALRAVGRRRALGLHFYGHFIGVSGRLLGDGRIELRIEGEPPGVGAATVSPTAIATLADLAMGGAVRSRVAPGARLGTVTLALRHPAVAVAGPLVAAARAEPEHGGFGTARCTIRAEDRAIGWGQAMFAVLPTPPGRGMPLTPWERPEPPAVAVPTPDELDAEEAAAVAAARAAGERAAARGTAVSEELLAIEWRAGAAGRSAGALPIGPELGNRVGHVQGGVLYGAASVAATRALAAPYAALADGYYQFLRPADGAILAAEATVVRRGRSVAFVEARLAVDATPVGLGLFSFRL